MYRLRVRQLAARSRRLERIVSERTLELQEAYARIEAASLTDPLTRLRTRRCLEQSIGADLQLADVLRAVFRVSDHLVRWGGEEFLVVARFIDRAHAPELAEKLRAAIEAHPFVLPSACPPGRQRA